jgi:hypothetical protein
VLLIFVLAQIFRRGSDMRAELAGTNLAWRSS